MKNIKSSTGIQSMFRKSIFSKLAVVISIVSMLFGIACTKKVVVPEDAMEYNRPVNFAGPLINSKFTAIDLLTKLQDSTTSNNPVQVMVDTGIIEKGLLYAEYKKPYNYEWDDVVDMPGIDTSGSYNLNPADFTTKSTKADRVIYEKIVANGSPEQRLDSGLFSAGLVTVTVNGISGITGNYIVVFPKVTKDGQPLTLPVGNLRNNFNESENLEGYSVVFSHSPAKDSSYIDVEIRITGASIDDSNPPMGPVALNYSFVVDQMSPLYLEGYYGSDTPLEEEFEMEFDVFEEMDFLDKVMFKGPQVRLDYENFFGVPVDAELVDAKFQTTISSAEDLGWDGLPIRLDNASWNNGSVVPYDGEILIDSSNSNIDEIINHYPNKVTFNVRARSNPGGDPDSDINFVTDENKFNSELILMLPFWIKTSTYTRTDTADFDVNSLFEEPENPNDFDPLDNISLVNLKFRFENAFPFKLEISIVAENEDGSYSNELLSDEEILQWSGLNADGSVDVNQTTKSEFDLKLTKSKLELYREMNVKRLLIKSLAGTTITTGAPVDNFVKLHDYNYLQTKVMLDIVSQN